MLTGAQQHAADRFAKSLLALSPDALMDTYHQATEDYKAAQIEGCDNLVNDGKLAGALPSQKFGANAAWLRLNVILYNLLSAYKRVGLPEEFHTARPKRLRLLLLNTGARRRGPVSVR